MVQVLQVLARYNFTVYCYFSDGRVKLYDAVLSLQGEASSRKSQTPRSSRNLARG